MKRACFAGKMGDLGVRWARVGLEQGCVRVEVADVGGKEGYVEVK